MLQPPDCAITVIMEARMHAMAHERNEEWFRSATEEIEKFG